jgi:hypothetical protein
MKRLIALIAIVGLMVGAVSAADAAKRRKKKKAKPVKTALYFHGEQQTGELDIATSFPTLRYNRMDTTKPAAGAPKSRPFTTWAGDPQMWNDCAGSYLLPVWTGEVSGRIVGDMKVTLNTLSAPKAVTVQVWPDLLTQTCATNDLQSGEYPEPAAQQTVDLPPGAGQTVVTLKKVNFKALGYLTIQILPIGPAPGRVLYDSADYSSSVAFSCIPAKGKRCTP